MSPTSTSAGTRFLLGAAGLVILIAGLRAAAPFLVPLVLAVFLTVINMPVLNGLRRLRVPTPAAVGAVVLMTFGLVALVVLVGWTSLSDIRTVLPVYLDRLSELEHSVLASLESRGVPVPSGVYASLLTEPDRLVELVSGVVRRAAGFLSAAAIVALYTIFMLLEAAGFPAKLRAAVGRTDADLSRFARAVRDIQRYLLIKTLIGLATGGLIALWLWILGVDFPLLWGTLAFLLNYVPNVGSLIAAVPALLFVMLQLGAWSAVLAAGGYLAVNITLGNLVEPNLMGRRFGLSTLVVIISLVFWGWLWGPVGMLLSVPLTVVVRIALEHTDDLRWLAVLLGQERGAATSPVVAPGSEAGDRAAGPSVAEVRPSGPAGGVEEPAFPGI